MPVIAVDGLGIFIRTLQFDRLGMDTTLFHAYRKQLQMAYQRGEKKTYQLIGSRMKKYYESFATSSARPLMIYLGV